MQEHSGRRRKPTIVVAEGEHRRLYRLASAAADRMPEVADELLSELDRAKVVADIAIPVDAVRIGSTVEFKPDTGPARTVNLVFPEQADIAEGRVSILTPIGTALIGLKPGQSITWRARDGRQHELTIVSVRQTDPVGELSRHGSRSAVQADA